MDLAKIINELICDTVVFQGFNEELRASELGFTCEILQINQGLLE